MDSYHNKLGNFLHQCHMQNSDSEIVEVMNESVIIGKSCDNTYKTLCVKKIPCNFYMEKQDIT